MAKLIQPQSNFEMRIEKTPSPMETTFQHHIHLLFEDIKEKHLFLGHLFIHLNFVA